MAASCPGQFFRSGKGFGPQVRRDWRAVARIGLLCSLDLNQLTKLAKAIGKLRSEGRPLTSRAVSPGYPEQFDSDLLVPPLVASAVRHGVALEVVQPCYDQVAQEALSPDSRSIARKPMPCSLLWTTGLCR